MPDNLLDRFYRASIRRFTRYPGIKPQGLSYFGCRLCGGEWETISNEQQHNHIAGALCPVAEYLFNYPRDHTKEKP